MVGLIKAAKMGSGSSPCASCKLLRRRCVMDCIFAPYFPPDDPQRFALVHKLFGASNVSKLLQELPVNKRGDAVSSLVFEANTRIRDPVYGCVGAISLLQNQVSRLQMQLEQAQAELMSIQMQQHLQNEISDDKSLVLAATINLHQYLNDFAASTANLIIQDPLKTESLWT
ncbi:LOB domain-containing protein 12 [Amaranthus tricolor]|uniref:LOB domain-containing protein 12 n=1 Tax=Amaranthus tricolor TaxID=29722 RepID=UPI002589A18C|nr:LOB domain-containing protein 12 [Amaranthus tricolor]